MTDATAGRVQALFVAARSMPAGERLAWLVQACQENDQAVVAEVWSLLQSDLTEDKTVGDGLLHLPPDGPTAAAESVGSRVGPYKLLQVIGEGGFGTVFMAEQSHPVRRRVALEIIKLGMDTREVVARSEAEWQALADPPEYRQGVRTSIEA